MKNHSNNFINFSFLMGVAINTDRFILREIIEEDASEAYLSWFRDPLSVKYITAAGTQNELFNLRQYIRARAHRNDVLFLGIFDATSGQHVGNIKYEPVNDEMGYAIMGILIGEITYRGIGVAKEVITASSKWLSDNRNIKEILLGVHTENIPAIKAYENMGFKVSDTPFINKKVLDSLIMKLDIANLK
jgi:RimJ/RimL family protein N-acetyltransferase